MVLALLLDPDLAGNGVRSRDCNSDLNSALNHDLNSALNQLLIQLLILT